MTVAQLSTLHMTELIPFLLPLALLAVGWIISLFA